MADNSTDDKLTVNQAPLNIAPPSNINLHPPFTVSNDIPANDAINADILSLAPQQNAPLENDIHQLSNINIDDDAIQSTNDRVEIVPKISLERRQPLSRMEESAIKVLADSGLKDTTLASISNRHINHIRNVKHSLSNELLDDTSVKRFKQYLAQKSLINISEGFNAITQEKLEDASYVQLMIGSKINLEIANNLEDRVSKDNNADNVLSTVDDGIAKLSSMLESLVSIQGNTTIDPA